MAIGVVAIHFGIVLLHSIAHEVLPVKATPAQLAFIIPVIVVAPILAGIGLLKFERAGTILLAASMLASSVFGVYYHFIADTIDHVTHVARMQPLYLSQMFTVTAYLLAISETAGTAVGIYHLSALKKR